jgi:hypothetical protein
MRVCVVNRLLIEMTDWKNVATIENKIDIEFKYHTLYFNLVKK